MSVGAVREPRHSARHDELARRRRREFHNVRHPSRPDLRVERILVSHSGIHVVTSVPSGSDRFLVSRSRVAADLVASLLPERYRGRVHPVLCRVDDVAMADLVNDVLVTTAGTLEHIVRSSPVVLSTSEVNEVALRLDARLEPFPMTPKPRQRRWTWRRALVAGVAAAASTTGILAIVEEAGLTALLW
jgi:hypothetical protein